jgi:signal transduction histidine kinase
VSPRLTRVETSAAERWAGAGALAAWLVAGVVFSPRSLPVALTAGAVGIAAALVWRTRSGRALVPGIGVASGAVLVLGLGSAATIGWFATCVLVVITFLGVSRTAGVAVAGGFALVIAVQLVLDRDAGWFAWLGGLVLTLVACTVIDHEQRISAALREAQAGLAARSAAEERTRIAREVHDVTGHALTVSLLHITSARLALDEDPDTAAEALAEAERLSRRSLEEVRAAVGVLRDGAQPSTPLPGAADVEELVASVRRTGVDVDLEVTGDPATLPDVLGLAVYRVVQEALTNVARHAPAAPTRVLVEVGRGARVRVDSAAPPRADARPGTGIAGMTERAEGLGGTLTAGPGGPGWRVEATWPAGAQGVTG